MDTTDIHKLSPDDRPEACREIIRLSLNEIAVEVETALRDASLDFPVYLLIPNTGTSIITVATTLDPPDADWSQASEIVCQLIGKKLGAIRLGTRRLQCSVANAKFEAADVTPDPTRR